MTHDKDAPQTPAVGIPVEREVRRRGPRKAAAPRTLGQVAYEVMRERAGGRPWAGLLEAEVRDWELAAAAVAKHATAKLQTLRASFVRIGAHRHSFWDTADDVALLDSMLACCKAPNVM